MNSAAYSFKTALVNVAVLQVVPSLDPQHGGPSRTVIALTDALARLDGCRVGLASQGWHDRVMVDSEVSTVERIVNQSNSRLALSLGVPCRQAMQRVRLSLLPHLIHSHGIWHPAAHWAARAARHWGMPLIAQPRGMLEPWALSQQARKKRLALALYQRRDLEKAAAIVATSEMEYVNLRRLGLEQPVAVIPNGVNFPVTGVVKGLPSVATPGLEVDDPTLQVDQRIEYQEGLGKERVALFLSRIHPKKGVLELVRAWSEVAPAGWRLCIAGPDENGHWRDVWRLVETLGLADKVDYQGSVAGERKASLYRRADLFVLPTYSENFGLVVAEALTYGIPVITTRGAPWADLVTYGCGWWIDTGVEPLVAALHAAISLRDEERFYMGERGRNYVRRFDWNRIAQETLDLYRWILGQGERPTCVHVN